MLIAHSLYQVNHMTYFYKQHLYQDFLFFFLNPRTCMGIKSTLSYLQSDALPIINIIKPFRFGSKVMGRLQVLVLEHLALINQLDALANRPNSSKIHKLYILVLHHLAIILCKPQHFLVAGLVWDSNPTLYDLQCYALPIELPSPLGARWRERYIINFSFYLIIIIIIIISIMLQIYEQY